MGKKTPRLTVRFSILKQTHPCYIPLRFVVNYNQKRLYATIPVSTAYPQSAEDFEQLYSDGDPIDKANKEVDIKLASEFVKGMASVIERIIEQVVKERKWEEFTSQDLKGILNILSYKSLLDSFDIKHGYIIISTTSIWLMNKNCEETHE